MKHIRFSKLTGAGNDFIVIDDRKRILRSAPTLARKLCDRRFGIGADGLILVERSSVADYRMTYYNADGSYGGMCGNGGRCVARFAVEQGIAGADHAFEALEYIYRASVRRRKVSLAMKDVCNPAFGLHLNDAGRTIAFHRLDTGSPHIVVPVPKGSLSTVPVEAIGRRLRHHRRFQPGGTNVNFVERTGINAIQMRTYERGVEEETLACGTGSIACAITATVLWKMKPPIEVLTWSRQRLKVNFIRHEDAFEGVKLSGPAVIVFEGTTRV